MSTQNLKTINKITKVKLIYETSFEIKLQENFNEAIRNEVIKTIISDKESFLSKLRIKVEDKEFPFLTESNYDSSDKIAQKQKQISEDFNEIFDVIVEESTKKNLRKKLNAKKAINMASQPSAFQFRLLPSASARDSVLPAGLFPPLLPITIIAITQGMPKQAMKNA